MKALFISCIFLLALDIFAANAVVEKIKGEAFVAGKAVAKGQSVPVGKSIKVVGFVVLRFADGSKMLLKDGQATVKAVDSKNSYLNLARGTLFASKVGQKTKMKISTSKASFAVRGTKFFIGEKEESSYLCVCEGFVEVKNKQGATVLVGKDEDVIVSPGKKLAKKEATTRMTEMVWDGLAEMGIKKNAP